MMKKFFLLLVSVCSLSGQAQQTLTTDVLVIGGSTGGTAAGIQSARLGVETIIVESTPWLGGMISAAPYAAIAVSYVLVNLLVDILYGVIDPRIRVSSQ